MAKVHIKQVRSSIGRPANQKATLVALGLGRIGKERELDVNEPLQGMINKVSHLITVTEL